MGHPGFGHGSIKYQNESLVLCDHFVILPWVRNPSETFRGRLKTLCVMVAFVGT